MGAYSQFAGIYDELPKYGQRIGDLVDGSRQKVEGMEERTYQLVVPPGSGQQQEQERLRAQQQAAAAVAPEERKSRAGTASGGRPPALPGAIPGGAHPRGAHAHRGLHLRRAWAPSTRSC